jgi:hypothetical protein
MRRERRGQPRRPWTAASRRTERHSFAEERAPCGSRGLLPDFHFGNVHKVHAAFSEMLVARVRPHLLVIWEPLKTKAPSPPKAAPFCCYRQTVIFYCSPYYVRPWKQRWRGAGGRLQICRPSFEVWDTVESGLTWDDVVEFEGERFQVGGGTVVWSKGRWWMRHGARRMSDSLAGKTGWVVVDEAAA